jgi:hypothetical protein
MLREGSEFALHATSRPSGKRRKKFITRIIELTPQAPVNLTQSYDPESFPAQGVGVSSREKNNLAARLSRRRKKMYIELLEEQNTNLEMELYSLGEEIEFLRTEIFNAIMHADEVVLPSLRSPPATLRSTPSPSRNCVRSARPRS